MKTLLSLKDGTEVSTIFTSSPLVEGETITIVDYMFKKRYVVIDIEHVTFVCIPREGKEPDEMYEAVVEPERALVQ